MPIISNKSTFTILKYGGIFGVIILAMILCFYWMKGNSDAALNSAVNQAYQAGAAKTQAMITGQTNAQLVKDIQEIQQMEQQTNNNMQQIAANSAKQQQIINSFNPTPIVITEHPQEIEQWANDTSTAIFNQIQGDSQNKIGITK